MICPNCSAEFDEKQLIVCPYCGYEHMPGARQEHEHEIRTIKKKTLEAKKQPEKLIRKSNNFLKKLVIAFLVVFLLVVIIKVVCSRIDSDRELHKQEEKLAYFEEIYGSGDYAKLYKEIMAFDESYSASFRKYYNVAWLYHSYCLADEWNYNNAYYLPLTYDLVTVDEIFADLKYSFEVMLTACSYEEAGYVYGERQAVEQIKNLMKSSVMTFYCLSEKEYLDMYNGYAVILTFDTSAKNNEVGENGAHAVLPDEYSKAEKAVKDIISMARMRMKDNKITERGE